MTTETKNAIDVLVQHFLLHQEKHKEQILQAIEHLAYSTDGLVFHQLGVATLTAMINSNLASLEAGKAVLVAGLPTKGPLQ